MEISSAGFYVAVARLPPTWSVKALRETQSTAPNWGKSRIGAILSSATTGQLMKGALVHLRWLSDANALKMKLKFGTTTTTTTTSI